VAAWVKPFCQFKAGVNPAYAWEPVVFSPCRRQSHTDRMVFDWLRLRPEQETGLVGSKPPAFCRWVFDLLGLEEGDDLDDLFPGTGAVQLAWERWRREPWLWSRGRRDACPGLV
jgi:hypothetical protein